MKFFYCNKPKKDSIRAHTNIRILHAEDIQSIISDMWYELEIEEITLESQQVQHHDVIKIECILDCILGMMDKINLQEWTDRLKKLIFTALKCKHLTSLKVAKINNGPYKKANSGSGFKLTMWNKQKNMAAHVEAIEFQKDPVRRVLKSMLLHIDKDMHGIEIRVVSVLPYLIDENMAARLKKLAKKNTVKSLITSKHMQ